MPDDPGATDYSTAAQNRVAAMQGLSDGQSDDTKTRDSFAYKAATSAANYGPPIVEVGAAVSGGASLTAAGALALPAAITLGAAIGTGALLHHFGVDKAISNGLTSLGDHFGLTIGRGGPHPACVGDDTAHSESGWGAFLGGVVGVVVGGGLALAGLALIAATPLTGGLSTVAGALVLGAALGAGATVGAAVADASKSFGTNCGKITTGSPDVFFENKPVARVTDVVACEHHPSPPQPLAEGSETISVNCLPIVRIGHKAHCSCIVNAGCKTVWIDNSTGQYGPMDPELGAWAEFGLNLLGTLVGGRAVGKMFKSAQRAGLPLEKITCWKDPIDVATGEFVDWRNDFSIPGVLPLVFERVYRTQSEAAGLLGVKWSNTWSQRLRQEGESVNFYDAEGCVLTFDVPYDGLDSVNLLEQRYWLKGNHAEPRLFDQRTQRTLKFSALRDGEDSRLVGIEDLNGNRIKLTYLRGRLNRVTHSDGYLLDLSYNDETSQLLTAVDLYDGILQTRLVDYHYEENRLVCVESFQFGEFNYRYDKRDRITRWSDSDQTLSEYTYDEAGRVWKTRAAEGLYHGTFEYYPLERRTRVVNIDGSYFEFTYNADNLVTAITDPLGNTKRTEWDDRTNKVRVTDPLGRSILFAYDEENRLISEVDPLERKTGYTYNATGLLDMVQRPDRTAIKYHYDLGSNLIMVEASNQPDLVYEYGERGELLSAGAAGSIERYRYDESQRVSRFISARGGETRVKIDLLGRVQERIDPTGAKLRFDYTVSEINPRGNIAKVTLPNGGEIDRYYNSEGLLVEESSPLGYRRRAAYGPFDLLISQTDAKGHTTRFDYDNDIRLRQVTNAAGEFWQYHYDQAGRLVGQTDWAGRHTEYILDAAGRRIEARLPDDSRWFYHYDEVDRLIELDAGDTVLRYRYNGRGAVEAGEVFDREGNLQHATKFQYDGKCKVACEDQHGQALHFQYDDRGWIKSRQTPHRSTAYEFDALGALIQVGELSIKRDLLGREVERATSSFMLRSEYDPMGSVTRQIVGMQSFFGALERNAEYALEHLERYQYSYDKAGKLVSSDNGRAIQTYKYDQRDQIVAATGPTGSESISYDSVGNIASYGRNFAPPEPHAYRTGGAPSRTGIDTTYEYDQRGRVVSRTVRKDGFRPKTWRYKWDGVDRLVKTITPDEEVWEYQYDAFNRRVAKVEKKSGRRIQFVWDGPTIAERWEIDADGTESNVVTWHMDSNTLGPLAQETADGLHSILALPNGMPKAIYDRAGRKRWEGKSTIWGQVLAACCPKELYIT
jgi:YD repeat-containing protein